VHTKYHGVLPRKHSPQIRGQGPCHAAIVPQFFRADAPTPHIVHCDDCADTVRDGMGAVTANRQSLKPDHKRLPSPAIYNLDSTVARLHLVDTS